MKQLDKMSCIQGIQPLLSKDPVLDGILIQDGLSFDNEAQEMADPR
ncbi:hypothetical protein Vi05172_g2634 [Venturia inaequalis]|nr:hypothetical protein Vi05172_g2634 [Venturia inaequalis]